MLLVLGWSAFPIYWALNTSLMTNNEAQARPAHFYPSPLTLASYRALLSTSGGGVGGQFLRAMLNVSIECIASALVTIVVGVAAAYALACLAFAGRRIIFGVVILTLMIPVYATLIPTYRILIDLHLLNTYTGIILVYAAGNLPLVMWIMYNYFSGIPRDMQEAAAVDGASPLKTLVTIMLPLARTGIIATAIISFLLSWSQFIFPLVLSTDNSTQPITVFITSLQSRMNTPFTLMNAAAVASLTVPVIVVMILNKYILSGVLEGSYR
jgi:multiple sugar transport system permease protein